MSSVNAASRVEYADSAWKLLGRPEPAERIWNLTPDWGKHTFQRVEGPIVAFRRGPRGGIYVKFEGGEERRVRPYWLK